VFAGASALSALSRSSTAGKRSARASSREVGVLTLDGGMIGELTAFRSPRSHVPFGVPAELPGP